MSDTAGEVQISEQDLGLKPNEVKTGETKEQPAFDALLLKTMSPERKTEFLAGWIMMGLEIYHEAVLNPEKPLNAALYRMTEPDQMPQLPTNPVTAWAVEHIGDIWEISAGHMALRLGFVAVNEVLKKTTGKEISDEACFWASLTTTVTVKAIHSLGYISLFGINDHMANPVPEMLFGQGVAAVVLAASHYAAKYGEPIKNLAGKAVTKIFEPYMNTQNVPDVVPAIVTNVKEK